LFLDACCVINLYATGRIREVLGVLDHRCAVARWVIHEVLLLAPDRKRRNVRERIDLASVIRAGSLTVVDAETAGEMSELVRFAREIDDGEAQTCALAVVRRAPVASDDRKVLRVLAREGLASFQTPELLHAWAVRARPGRAALREALGRVETLASFRPRPGTPQADWWRESLT
jgi:hypothetical protein